MSEAYKISVAIALASNHNAVLAALSSGLLGVHTKVKQLEGGFKRLHAVIGGALAVGAGMALFGVMEKLIEKTKDYSDELVKLQRLGGGMEAAVLSGDISRRAFDISQRVPMAVPELMKIPGATYSIIGQEESMAHWESLAKLSFVLRSQKDYNGDPGKDLQELIRAGEMSGRITDKTTGQIDPAKLEAYLDQATRIIAATHGMVGPQSLLGMAKQGGFMLRGLSDEGFYNMAIMSQAMGGNRAGTALLSLGQQMMGGQMQKRSAQGMEDLGLLKPGEWSVAKGSGSVVLGDEASKRLSGLITKDPSAFAAKIMEQFKEKGITDPEEQMRMIMRAAGRQTTQRFTAEEVTNYQQMKSELERLQGGYGKSQSFNTIMDKSVGANIEAVSAAWNNLLTAVSGPNSENVIKFLQNLTSNINAMQKMITATDPNTIANIGYGIGILAASLTGAGAAAILLALGPAGWLTAGIIGLAAAIVAFPDFMKSHSMSDAVIGWFNSAWDGVTAWVGIHSMSDAVVAWFGKAWDGITGWLASHSLADAIIGWLSPIIDKIKGLLGSIGVDKGGSYTSPGKTGMPAQKMLFQGGDLDVLRGGSSGKPLMLDASLRNSLGIDKNDDADRRAPSIKKDMMFQPGSASKHPQPISLSLNVDGRTLAQVISEQLDNLYEHATGAPSYNGQSHYTRADGGLMGT